MPLGGNAQANGCIWQLLDGHWVLKVDQAREYPMRYTRCGLLSASIDAMYIMFPEH